MCIRSGLSVYVCVRCYRTTISKEVCSACISHEKVLPMLMDNQCTWYSVCIWGLDKEQMYGGEAVTACSKFLQFSGH